MGGGAQGSNLALASKQPGKGTTGNRKNPFNQRRQTTNEEDMFINNSSGTSGNN